VLTQKPAEHDLNVGEGRHVGTDTLYADAIHLLGSIMHDTLTLVFHADVADEGGMCLEELELLARQLGITTLHFQIFLGIKGTDHDHAANAKSVGAHVGDIFRDVAIHSVDHGHDGDQSGSGQNNAE